MKKYKTCNGCKHAPGNWQDFADIPACNHPTVSDENNLVDPGKGVAQLHTTDKEYGFCGPYRKHYEQIK